MSRPETPSVPLDPPTAPSGRYDDRQPERAAPSRKQERADALAEMTREAEALGVRKRHETDTTQGTKK